MRHASLPTSLRRARRRPDDVDAHPDDVASGAVEAIEAARAGDRAAFAELYDRFHPLVYRTVRARVGVPEDAEDLVAETFLAAWKALPRFTWTGAPFAAWLLTLAMSQAASHHRRAGSRPRTAGGEHAERALDHAEPHEPHAHVDARMEAMHLLELLPDELRTVLALRFYGGLGADEIGRMLGKRAGTVRQMQMTALERLARHAKREQAA